MTRGWNCILPLLISLLGADVCAWIPETSLARTRVEGFPISRFALSDKYLENDLVAVRLEEAPTEDSSLPRLCVVRPDATVLPLCQHEDDVETDLFLDPRGEDTATSTADWEGVTDEDVVGTYGEGWYGQRPVPSLGGGPGYGAPAQEIWSVDEEILEALATDGVELPILDIGIAHGEKARGGAF